LRLLPRLLLGALIVSAPGLLALLLLVWLQMLAPGPAVIAVVLVYAVTVVVTRPLLTGLAAVIVAVEAMLVDPSSLPEVKTQSPEIRELWRAIGRWARAGRARLSSSQGELAAARAILAAVPEPLVLIDAQRRVVSANAAATALLGDRLVDRDLAGALRHPAVLTAVDAVLRGEGDRVVEFDTPSPVERHLSARLAPLPLQSAGGAAAVLVLHDLTALKRSEQLRADFVANASHELRTPLATLVGFVETLRGPARDDKAAGDRFLAIMAEQAARMSRLVDDLLSLSRIEMNEHRPPTGALALAPVLETVARSLEQRAAARGIRIALAIPSDLPPIIGDPDELAQVFQNLIDNALKYGAPRSVVEVSAFRSPRALPGGRGGPRVAAVAVAVRDHGEGIARELLPRLTERFYRVDAARSRELGGTGLGLAIVKHIVGHHRGALDIESELGEGSVFTVHLPAAGLS
jgi:two-component system, OmpR family, phosphate regulon sensor histidine kinase PhoR